MTIPTCPKCATPVASAICPDCRGNGSNARAVCPTPEPTATDCRECNGECECPSCGGHGSWFECPSCGWRGTDGRAMVWRELCPHCLETHDDTTIVVGTTIRRACARCGGTWPDVPGIDWVEVYALPDPCTPAQLAVVLDVTAATVRRWIDDGELGAHKRGVRWRVWREDVVRWARANA